MSEDNFEQNKVNDDAERREGSSTASNHEGRPRFIRRERIGENRATSYRPGFNRDTRPAGNYSPNDRGGFSRNGYVREDSYNNPRQDYHYRPRTNGDDTPYGDRERTPYNRDDRGGYGSYNNGGYNRDRNAGYNREGNSGYNREGGYSRSYTPNGNRTAGGYDNYGQERRYYNRNNGISEYNGENRYSKRPPFSGTRYDNQRQGSGYTPRFGRYNGNQGNYDSAQTQGGYRRQPGTRYSSYGNNSNNEVGYSRSGRNYPQRRNYPSNVYSQKKRLEYKEENYDPNQPIRLNKFLANAGVCSRRDADKFIVSGVVSVNGKVVTELGTKVLRSDTVLFHDQAVKMEKKVYVLLNKPKGYVTTSEDPEDRKTVMDLVKDACHERIYPVGRLDRNTTGVLLLTNDGELASKLTHPKFLKKKIYHVTLDHNASMGDLQKIMAGIELEDGEIKADAIEYADAEDKKQVGIEIHSGKNRIVRRIFEHLGYHVIKLDRVYFAGLTKKNVRRGDWRYLTEKEVDMLRMGAFE